jgi:hypothetical protein
MIELATSQRENGHLQLSQLIVDEGGIGTQGTAELGIEIVFFEVSLAG